MSDAPKPVPQPLLKKTDIDGIEEIAYQHRLNPKALRHTKSLGAAAGMSHIGVHLVRLAPGSESTEYHFHHHEEEFIYILSGRGEAEIGEERHEVAPGDFLGFGAPSPPHTMRNPYDEELVYLVGGERLTHDVTEYPRMKKFMYKVRGERHVVAAENIEKL